MVGIEPNDTTIKSRVLYRLSYIPISTSLQKTETSWSTQPILKLYIIQRNVMSIYIELSFISHCGNQFKNNSETYNVFWNNKFENFKIVDVAYYE